MDPIGRYFILCFVRWTFFNEAIQIFEALCVFWFSYSNLLWGYEAFQLEVVKIYDDKLEITIEAVPQTNTKYKIGCKYNTRCSVFVCLKIAPWNTFHIKHVAYKSMSISDLCVNDQYQLSVSASELAKSGTTESEQSDLISIWLFLSIDLHAQYLHSNVTVEKLLQPLGTFVQLYFKSFLLDQ